MNEEFLRAHILLPYLRSLGFSPQEVEVEKKLRLRLGRTIHEREATEAHGRADVLVRDPQGRNLFIVELKAPGLPLLDDDRDQGISYARLLDQIAPFVILTNGQLSRIFDSITKAELDPETLASSSFYASGGKLATAEDLAIRWEALESFVGYSRQNVEAFSRTQIADRIRPLTVDLGSNRKYVRELYVRRAAIRCAFARFLTGPGSAFAIVGDSGVGKTNEMCALAESLSDSHIVLFFAAYLFVTSPGHALVEDFNWEFSQSLELPQLLSRLKKIERALRRPVVIFIDALDEAPLQNLPETLSEFATRIHSTEGAVKLVISVKESEWRRFSKIRGNPSGLSLALDATWRGCDDSNKIPDALPFSLGIFSDEELTEAIPKYRDAFRLPDLPASQLRILCRDPFMLRVVSETYAGRSEPLPTDLSESALVREWLDRKFATMFDAEQARRDLVMLADSIYRKAVSLPRGGDDLGNLHVVEESHLPRVPNSELISHAVIVRSTDSDGRSSFRLSHTRVLDYLIARHVLVLDTLTPTAFAKALDPLLSNYVLQGALAWHMREASPAHLHELRRSLRGRAALFLSTYTSIITRVVPGARERVQPFTLAEIGVAYFPKPYGISCFGLFPVGEVSMSRVLELDGDQYDFNGEMDQLHAIGCPRPQGGGRDFGNSDPVLAASEFVHKQLSDCLVWGALNEGGCELLARESILAICSGHRDKLGLPKASRQFLRPDSLVPLDLAQVSLRLQYEFGKSWYWRQLANEFLRSGKGESTDKNGVTFTSIELDPVEEGEAYAKAMAEAKAGAKFPPHNGELAALSTLLSGRPNVLEQPVLPSADLKFEHWHVSFSQLFSDSRLREFIGAFFDAGLDAYRSLVEVNFPGLTDSLSLYTRMPCIVVASYERPNPNMRPVRWGHILWGICTGGDGVHRSAVSLELIDPSTPIWDLLQGLAPKGFEISFCSSSDMSSLLQPYDSPGFGLECTRAASSREAPVRAFAYHLLREDFKKIKAKDLLKSLEAFDVR